MKISSINNIYNKKLNIKNSQPPHKSTQTPCANEKNKPVNSTIHQTYNNISFQALKPFKKQDFYQHLSANGKDYLYLTLSHFDDPVIFKSECVNNYFKDKTGKVNPDYVQNFINFYNKFYDEEMEVSDNIISLSKEIIEKADENSRKSPELNLPEKVVLFDSKKAKINYYTEQNKIKANARTYLYNEAENKKNFPIIALDKAFMLIQLSKTEDGYSFTDYEKKKPIINELFMISDKTQFDFKTPIINSAKDKNCIVDFDLFKTIIDFMYEMNWQANGSFDEIANVLKTLKTNPQNDMQRVMKYLVNLAEITIEKPKEFEYVANQCINKNTNKFNDETFATIMNLYSEAEYSSIFICDDFSEESLQKYKEFESELVHSYLKANNDEQTGTIREDADSIIEFTQEFLENKKEELN